MAHENEVPSLPQSLHEESLERRSMIRRFVEEKAVAGEKEELAENQTAALTPSAPKQALDRVAEKRKQRARCGFAGRHDEARPENTRPKPCAPRTATRPVCEYRNTTLWPAVTEPVSSFSLPASTFISVDLPAPFGPTRRRVSSLEKPGSSR